MKLKSESKQAGLLEQVLVLLQVNVSLCRVLVRVANELRRNVIGSDVNV